MNAMCERLAESMELPCKTPFHVLTGITLCVVPGFVGPFELILNNDLVRHMEYGATVNDKRNLERVKNITPMENPSTI